MRKSISLALGRMRSSAVCIRKQPICFHCFQLITVGPNSDESDQLSRKHILICNLCVKRHMIPFSIAFKSRFYANFMCRSAEKKFVLSKCQNAKYAESMLASYMKKLLPGNNSHLDW